MFQKTFRQLANVQSKRKFMWITIFHTLAFVCSAHMWTLHSALHSDPWHEACWWDTMTAHLVRVLLSVKSKFYCNMHRGGSDDGMGGIFITVPISGAKVEYFISSHHASRMLFLQQASLRLTAQHPPHSLSRKEEKIERRHGSDSKDFWEKIWSCLLFEETQSIPIWEVLKKVCSCCQVGFTEQLLKQLLQLTHFSTMTLMFTISQILIFLPKYS